MYRSGRPGRLAKAANRVAATQFSAGKRAPEQAMTMELRGRSSGRIVTVPVMVADLGGQRYLVSMLGNDANWVQNARAADGRAVLRRGTVERVRLEEVDVADRPPILRRYLEIAPGARPHIPVDQHAPVEAFVPIAAQYPVFRIVSES
jgi:hypothetical protein